MNIYDPEFQRINGIACKHQSGASQCATFLGEIVGVRNWWRKIARGDVCSYKSDEARELFALASDAIGPVINEAVRRQREHEAEVAKANAQLEALLTRAPRTWPSQQEEMDAWARRIAEAKAENDGCCGGLGVPDETGYCFGVGYCPRVLESRQCVKFIASYEDWLNQINEQTALAAVAARLSSPPPLGEMGVQNV